MRIAFKPLVGALAWLAVATALAQDRPMTFKLPAQPLASALKALSQEANLQMFYTAEAVRDKTTHLHLHGGGRGGHPNRRGGGTHRTPKR